MQLKTEVLLNWFPHAQWLSAIGQTIWKIKGGKAKGLSSPCFETVEDFKIP